MGTDPKTYHFLNPKQVKQIQKFVQDCIDNWAHHSATEILEHLNEIFPLQNQYDMDSFRARVEAALMVDDILFDRALKLGAASQGESWTRATLIAEAKIKKLEHYHYQSGYHTPQDLARDRKDWQNDPQLAMEKAKDDIAKLWQVIQEFLQEGQTAKETAASAVSC